MNVIFYVDIIDFPILSVGLISPFYISKHIELDRGADPATLLPTVLPAAMGKALARHRNPLKPTESFSKNIGMRGIMNCY